MAYKKSSTTTVYYNPHNYYLIYSFSSFHFTATHRRAYDAFSCIALHNVHGIDVAPVLPVNYLTFIVHGLDCAGLELWLA